MLARSHFDLITIDVIMPGVNGVELWHRLRAEDPSAAGRVVFVTGNVDPSLQAAVDATGRPVLAKPYTFKALRAVVASNLGARVT
jgi:CheY-like chemotaxis protein